MVIDKLKDLGISDSSARRIRESKLVSEATVQEIRKNVKPGQAIYVKLYQGVRASRQTSTVPFFSGMDRESFNPGEKLIGYLILGNEVDFISMTPSSDSLGQIPRNADLAGWNVYGDAIHSYHKIE